MTAPNYKLACLLAALALPLLPTAAAAEQQLTEREGAPFHLAVHPWLKAELRDHSQQPGMQLASVLPADISALDVLVLNWPKSDVTCSLGVAQQGGQPPGENGSATTCLAVAVGEYEPQRIELERWLPEGVLNRLCVWPTTKSATADLVFLLSFPATAQDAEVLGFRVRGTGEVDLLDTTGALTLYGWFDVRDLDDDGNFELITSRNLDGTWGGFFYHAVRAYNAESAAYQIAPDGYQEFFERELAWLEWVIATRPLIQEDPGAYLNQSGVGPVYTAAYEGTVYGFDSIIEVPSTFSGVEDVEGYNRERREAYRLITRYRDELAAWLNGGEYPATWKLAP